MATYDTAALLTNIKRRGFFPTNQSTFSDTDFLAFADEELLTRIVPAILDVQEEYFVFDQDTTLSGSTTSFTLPPRAMAGKVREIQILDSSGNTLLDVPRIELESLDDVTSNTVGFYFKNNKVVFVNAPSSGNTLRISYYIRPNRLTTAAAGVWTITAINTSTKTLTVSGGPGVITSEAGNYFPFDLIRGTSPFDHLGIDLAYTSTSATDHITMTATLPTGLAVGDYLAASNTTCVPQLPVEYHPVLVEAVCLRAYESQKDRSAAEMHAGELQRMLSAIQGLSASRADGAPKKVVNRRSPYHPRFVWRSW